MKHIMETMTMKRKHGDEMEEFFNAQEIQDFIRTINCMSDIEFFEMYRYVLSNRTIIQSYVDEKFRLCRSSFINWICEIDIETLNGFMAFCLDK